MVVKSFGMTNAPSTFMRLMAEFFRPYIGKFVVVYMDAILIFSKIREEHLQHLNLVFEALGEEELCINLHRCLFFKKDSVYLEFNVSKQGLHIEQRE